jgi:hypothetical protein
MPTKLKLDRYLGRYVCEVFMPDGDSAPLIVLAIHWFDPTRDFMDLDREICKAGITKFVRQATPNDWPPPIPREDRAPWVLVTELAPGVRRRQGFSLGEERHVSLGPVPSAN